jgi:hypothetical protein
MRIPAALLIVATTVLGSACTTVYRGERSVAHRGSQGIPPGHLPPPGSCRVWYEGRPPGRQPAPTSCRDAKRAAAGQRGARVIYSQAK